MKKHSTLVVLSATLSIVLLLAAVGVQPAWAEGELEAKYEAKIAKPFVAHGGWIVDYDEALARAEKEKKFIFTYFTRSYSK